MAYINVYKKSKNVLENFLQKKISGYSQYRNFDYGPNYPHKAVSGLSPYISKGIIKEEYILNKINDSKNGSDKFIQEVLWRTYWKGWLERHKEVWVDYKDSIKCELDNIYNNELEEKYERAIHGQTKLEPYDEWVNQLKNTGYLHNHARMWFASIWVHYFGLPWQLGAQLFYNHLLDADIASNTLSWRWVAGLQTSGKKYIATSQNIMKFSLSRFKSFSLPKQILLDVEYKKYKINEINYNHDFILHPNKRNAFLVVENNLDIDFIKDNKDNIFIVLLLETENFENEISPISKKFQTSCSTDFINVCEQYGINVKKINISKSFDNFLKILKEEKISHTCSEYITVGFEKDIVKRLIDSLKKRNISYNFFLSNFYKEVWSYCDKGFFNFKKNFDKLYHI